MRKLHYRAPASVTRARDTRDEGTIHLAQGRTAVRAVFLGDSPRGFGLGLSDVVFRRFDPCQLNPRSSSSTDLPPSALPNVIETLFAFSDKVIEGLEHNAFRPNLFKLSPG